MDYTKLKNTELFLFDMDGTLYLGDNVYAFLSALVIFQIHYSIA